NIEESLNNIKDKIRDGASRDYCGSRGEYINGIILSHYLGFEFLDAVELIYFKDDGGLDEKATNINIKEKLKDRANAIIPGFYGVKSNGEINLFSRGGSDITASIIASGINAKLYENWTDVSGFLLADPSIVDNSNTI